MRRSRPGNPRNSLRGACQILHQLIDGLEKLAWLIKSENRKV